MPHEGAQLFNHEDMTAITYHNGKWGPPVKLPAEQSGKMAPTGGPEVGALEDVGKTAAPALERGVVEGVTAIPTLVHSLAKVTGAGADYLPPGIGEPIKHGAEATSDFLKPFTYPDVQGKVESSYNQAHPKDPLYYPKTSLGQFAESGIQGGLAAVGGPFAMIKALTGPLAKVGGRLATGIGAGIGSEAAGQVADAADMGPYVSWAARAGGALVGGREAAERPRKLVTPSPQISQAHTDMANLLKQQPGNIDTAGQATGNVKQLQKDANLAPYAKAPYNNLATTQPLADTRVLLGTTGVNPAATAKGADRGVIQQALREAGARRDALEANTKMTFDPQFQQELQDAQNEYHRVSGTKPDPATPSPIERRINELYNPKANSRTMGLFGGDTTDRNGNKVPGYSSLRSDISKEATNWTKTDPAKAASLAKVRDALDAAMERAQAGTPYEGQWKENNQQFESAKVLEKATKQRAPAAGLLEPNTVNNSSRDPDAQIAQLARAQAVVHKTLPPPSEPSGLIPTMAGALMSHLTGSSSPEEGAIAGSVSGPTIAKSLLRNPITAGYHFSDFNQARQRNQSWQPGPGSTMDPATVARLLALQKVGSTPPDPSQ